MTKKQAMKPPVLGRPRALALVVWLAAASWVQAAERVVAVGDIHGAFESFVSVLQEAGLVDKSLAWTGGKAILVQTGDVLDRGPKSREALDLLMSLVEKAKAQGGEVRPLLGNHEAMVMSGDMRYVSPGEYQSFATPDSEKLREKEYDNYAKYRRQRASRTRQPAPSGDAAKQAWMELHPPGFLELRQGFSPSGKYGKWLRMQDAVTQVDDTIFLHGGLSPDLKLKNLKDINEQVRRDLQTFDTAWERLAKRGIIWQYHTQEEAMMEAKLDLRAQQAQGTGLDPDLVTLLTMGSLTFASPTGPLWYRGYAQEAEAEFAPKLDHVLKQFKAKRVVVGHTIPAAKRVLPRFDNRVFLIDTGMLAASFQGRPSALEIAGGQCKILYVGEPAQPVNANGK